MMYRMRVTDKTRGKECMPKERHRKNDNEKQRRERRGKEGYNNEKRNRKDRMKKSQVGAILKWEQENDKHSIHKKIEDKNSKNN